MNRPIKIRILTVDDDPSFRDYLHMVISTHVVNVEIVKAHSGAEAQQRVQESSFDLMISDLSMPEMNGRELLQSISQLPANHHPKFVLLLSGYLACDSSLLGTSLKKINYLSKPFDDKLLVDFIERVRRWVVSNTNVVGVQSNTPLEDSLLIEMEKYLKELF